MRIRIAIMGLIGGGLLFGWAQQPSSKTGVAPNAKPDSAQQSLLVDYLSDLSTDRGDGIIRMVGNVVFHHNGAIIQCDSAFKYDEHRMDFFGKVVIWQDSTFIYGDRVEYDGRTSVAHVFAPIIKMMRGDVTLYTYHMTFNTKTETGIFWGGGVVTQKENLMESDRGEYNSKTNTVKFLDSVCMRNDRYRIRTDSVMYLMDAEQATFLARTYIWDSERDFLRTDWGDYYAKDSTYVFTRNPYAMMPEREMWADTMRYNTARKQVHMFSNAQITDTVNTSVLFADWAFYDDSLGRAILTQTPSVRGWQAPAKDSITRYDSLGQPMVRKADTTYMRGDSILLDSYAPGTSKQGVTRMMFHRDTTIHIDTLGFDLSQAKLFRQIDTVGFVRIDPRDPDKRLEEHKVVYTIDTARYRQVEQLLLQPIVGDSTQRDSTQIDSIQRDSTIVDSLPPQFDTIRTGKMVWVHDVLQIKNTEVPDTINKERIIRSFKKVKIFNDGYQAVCDSLVSYSVDSTATMYIEPIMWNETNQITAQEMTIYTVNEAMDWADFTGDPFIAQQAVKNDTTHFNQASGKRLRAFFTNNELENALMTGNVLNLYYKDEGGILETMAAITCAELNIIFEQREPVRMIWKGTGEGTIYPIEDIPATQPLFLEGFTWLDTLRPKSAIEVCRRIERPSIRAQAERYHKPTYAISLEMARRKEELTAAGQWSDRTEQPTVTPDYFLTNNTYL